MMMHVEFMPQECWQRQEEHVWSMGNLCS